MADAKQPEVVVHHQTVGFHFNVKFINLPDASELDVGFQSVSGLDVEVETEPLKEGGENRFEHVLPGRSKYTKLTLKRGMLKPGQSGLTSWCVQAFQNQVFSPLETVQVELLNDEHEILVAWVLSHVWPTSWKIAELNAERGEVLIETLELNYNRFRLIKGK